MPVEEYHITPHVLPSQPLIRGHGNTWPISGYIEGNLKQIRQVQVCVNGQVTPFLELFEVQHEIDSIDFFQGVLQPNVYHFCHFISTSQHPDSKIVVQVLITTEDAKHIIHFHEFEVLEEVPSNPAPLQPSKIAICMATFNPNIKLFEQQLNSIINQTETSWQLLINDDLSDPEIFQKMQTLVSNDARIHVFQNSTNLGFYYNFESCLNKVHTQFEYIALADQDDYWRPEKLSALIDNIGSNLLIYNDMEIRDEKANLISESFWKYRSNHYKNFSALFLANTVTGSASLFRSSFLRKLLPLPTKIGNSFHDHWMGLAASIGDGLTYLDEVHQTYIQHANNVTGYGLFKTIDVRQSTLSLLSLQRMKMALTLDGDYEKNKLFAKNNLKVYFDAYLRRKLQYHILKERFPAGSRTRLDQLFMSKNKSIRQLLLLHYKIYQNDWMTNNAELSYINAIEVMKKMRVKLNGE